MASSQSVDGVGSDVASRSEPLASQLRARRSEMMVTELEAVALRLFGERGFGSVNVEEIAAAAQISVRTFYRYFPAKEDVLQVRIERRSAALKDALASRPADEPPLHSLRLAFVEVMTDEDVDLTRRWITVVAGTPSAITGVLGGIQLKIQPVIAEFFGARLGLATDDLIPVMLAAAAGGVIQAAFTRWWLQGGDIAAALSEPLAVLEDSFRADPRPARADEPG